MLKNVKWNSTHTLCAFKMLLIKQRLMSISLVSSMLSQLESLHPGDPGNSTHPPTSERRQAHTVQWPPSQCCGGSSSCSLVKRKTKYHNGKGWIKWFLIYYFIVYLENHREAAGKNIQNKREFDKVVNQEPPCLETTRNYDRKKKKKKKDFIKKS